MRCGEVCVFDHVAAQGDRYLRPGRQQTTRHEAVIGRIISDCFDKRTYLF